MSYLYDPIITPFFSYMNLTLGMLFCSICIIIPVFFSNTFNSAYFPINSSHTFDNTATQYSMSHRCFHRRFLLGLGGEPCTAWEV